MFLPNHTQGPWDADAPTVFYSSEGYEVTMIEIRANVTEGGWDTVAFVEAIWPGAEHNAHFISKAPEMFDALFDIKRIAEKSGDCEAAELYTLLDLIAHRARQALAKANGRA